MNTFQTIKTISKMNNIIKGLKIKVLLLGTIEWVLTGYKLIFIIPTMLIKGLAVLFNAIWEKLDDLCYVLPSVCLIRGQEQEKVINAFKEYTRTKKLTEKDLK